MRETASHTNSVFLIRTSYKIRSCCWVIYLKTPKLIDGWTNGHAWTNRHQDHCVSSRLICVVDGYLFKERERAHVSLNWNLSLKLEIRRRHFFTTLL